MYNATAMGCIRTSGGRTLSKKRADINLYVASGLFFVRTVALGVSVFPVYYISSFLEKTVAKNFLKKDISLTLASSF